jgi:hypothetical protein
MISIVNGKWRDKDGLRDILDSRANEVYLDGKVVRTNENWSGYASQIPYNETVILKHGGKTYGFKKRTNNSVEVF